MLFWTFTKEKEVRGKSDNAFSQLCNSTYNELKKYVLRLTNGDRYASEEIVQYTYEVAARNREKLLSHENPIGWLYDTAKKRYYKYIEKHGKITENEVELKEDTVTTIEEKLQGENEIIYRVLSEKIIAQLSEKEKQLLTAHYIEKQTLKEIAEETNEDYERLRKAHYRLMEKLRSTLNE